MWFTLRDELILGLFYILFVWIRELDLQTDFLKTDANRNIFSDIFIGLLSP